MRELRLGITGGIGCGKSVVSRILGLMGIPVYDCDSEAKRLTQNNDEIRRSLISLLGDRVYDNHGILNKSFLASYVFSTPEHTERVNNIIHPIVKADFEDWAKEQLLDHPIIGLESAILFESGLDDIVDKVLFVDAPLELRIRRTIQRDGSSLEQVKKRIDAQMDSTEKMKHSHFVVVNDNKKSLISQVQGILNELKGL